MHPILQRKLTEVFEAHRLVRARKGHAILLLLAAIAMALLWGFAEITSAQWPMVLLCVGGGLLIGSLLVRVISRGEANLNEIAREIESAHPEMRATLLTAMEQQPKAEGFSYMQLRVVEEAVRQAVKNHWQEELTAREFQKASVMRALALLLFAGGFGLVVHKTFVARKHEPAQVAAKDPEKPKPSALFDITVTPGDAEVERGSRLVVEAKFAKDVPPDAMLVVSDAKGAERTRMPMRATVDTKVFGGLVSNIKDDGVYRVEFEGGRSKDFKITTFVHPELDHADATITPPSYAKQPTREVKNTLKVTALEGSKIGWKMKINKPIKDAELYADKDHIIPLKADPKDATTLLANMLPDESRKYRLHLVDASERSNKTQPLINITVLKNTLPKIEIAFPKRDAKVSKLQELPLEAKLWDDVGVDKAGAVIEFDTAKRDVDLALQAPDKGKKIGVKTMLNLEPEKVEPLQMVSYYFWAEDKGPQGETRRSMSDMFFAEVRPFDGVFREKEAPPSDEEGEPKEGEAQKLLKMQKDIVNANWRLVRDQNSGRETKAMKGDVDTVMTSQSMNDENTEKAIAKVKGAKLKGHLQNAQKEMKSAEAELAKASDAAEAKAVPLALEAEQRALRHLFMAQSLETDVTQADPKSKAKGEQAKQQELEELELKQKEKRYEEDKVASEEKTAEQQENLAVLNKLKELARREEALAEKMKQIEQQLAQAKTEDQKEELANQLKRLQDEQEQLLRDLDDLREKMEKPENAANMADAKKQLDETREKVSEALDQMKEDKVAQASASATRAQKDLEKARDDFRQRTAKRFSEEMKQMRDEARDLAKAQQKLDESLENQKKPEASKDAFDTSAALRQGLSTAQQMREFEEQRERAKKLMENMQRVSEQAEETEPLLHKHLYAALRDARMQGLEENLTEAGQQARYNDRTAAQDADHKASKAVDGLKEGVEKAAESVLGNESEALRMARNELDKLIKEAGDDKQGAGGKEQGDQKSDAKGDVSKTAQKGKGEQPGKEGEGKGDKQTADAQKGQGKGEQPGKKGEGKGDKQTADAQKGQGKGEQPGKEGEGKGDKQTADAQKGQGKGEQPGKEGEGKGEQPGKGGEGKGESNEVAMDAKGQGKGAQQGQGKEPGKGGQKQANKGNASNSGGGGGDWFFDAATEVADNSPITGDGFNQWSDRLRNVEEMLTQPAMRNEAAKILDHARNLRTDAKKNNGAPQAEPLKNRILAPLVELRNQVSEELARREGKNPLSPVDRDQVPEKYRELVQKYYEQLGAGK